MKKFVLLFAVVFSFNVFACECGNWGKQFDSYSSSELVADVTITRVYPILKGKYSDKYFKIDLTQITQLKFFEISLWGNPKFRRTIFCVFW